MRILAISNHPAPLQSILLADGHDVEFYGNGNEALRLARQRDYTAIVLDYPNIDDMAGYDLLCALVSASKTPIIVITDLASNENRVMNLGAAAHFRKPYDPSKPRALLELIEKVVKPA